jgi:hypothetical protein
MHRTRLFRHECHCTPPCAQPLSLSACIAFFPLYEATRVQKTVCFIDGLMLLATVLLHMSCSFVTSQVRLGAIQSRENQTDVSRQACFLTLPKDARSKCIAIQKAHAVEARTAERLPLPLALLLLHALRAVPVTFWKVVRSLRDANKRFSRQAV